jgi:prefoldin subunit 5
MKIETLALSIQKDFDSLHGEIADIRTEMATLATKEELKSTKDEILSAIQKMDNKLTAYTERTNEIDIRLRVVEKRG